VGNLAAERGRGGKSEVQSLKSKVQGLKSKGRKGDEKPLRIEAAGKCDFL
jgi:hypothetical protein